MRFCGLTEIYQSDTLIFHSGILGVNAFMNYSALIFGLILGVGSFILYIYWSAEESTRQGQAFTRACFHYF